jgi:hypothetical protein
MISPNLSCSSNVIASRRILLLQDGQRPCCRSGPGVICPERATRRSLNRLPATDSLTVLGKAVEADQAGEGLGDRTGDKSHGSLAPWFLAEVGVVLVSAAKWVPSARTIRSGQSLITGVQPAPTRRVARISIPSHEGRRPSRALVRLVGGIPQTVCASRFVHRRVKCV